MFVHLFDINCSKYTIFQKILTFFLRNLVLSKIKTFFNQLFIFKNKINKRFPLFDIYFIDILLKIKKLFIKWTNRKCKDFANNIKTLIVLFYIINFINLFTIFLLSNINQTIYNKLTYFVNQLKEFYYLYN